MLLNLGYDEPLSNFAFKFNLRRYTKAEELINHFRGEAVRQRDMAQGAEGAAARNYELERENAELKETALGHQGRILRMEQEAARLHQQRLEQTAAEVDAGASKAAEAAGGGGTDAGAWGSDEIEAFTGLRWAKQATGIHHFCHQATGFTFQLSAADPEAYDDDSAGPGMLVATSQHTIQLKTRGFKTHWMTWRAICTSPYSEPADARGRGGSGGRRSGVSDVMSGRGAAADEVSFMPLVGPHRYCPSRHPPHLRPTSLELSHVVPCIICLAQILPATSPSTCRPSFFLFDDIT
jgi:hypothetical protein